MKYYGVQLRKEGLSVGKKTPVVTVEFLDDASVAVAVKGKRQERLFSYEEPGAIHVKKALDYATALADELGGYVSFPRMTMTGPDVH